MDYLIDTNICIYELKDKYNIPKKIQSISPNRIFISEITVAELKFGAAKSKEPLKNKKLIESYIKKYSILTIYNVLDIYADEKTRLRNNGLIIDDFDLLIGSTAIFNSLTLITNNIKHFKRLNNIKLENWINPQ